MPLTSHVLSHCVRIDLVVVDSELRAVQPRERKRRQGPAVRPPTEADPRALTFAFVAINTSL
jgi:hypothetical protein